MSTAAGLPRVRAWLRVLVLVCALLAPGEVDASTPTPAPVATVEYDTVEAALPALVHPAHRSPVPLRPAPLPDPAPDRAATPRTPPLPRTRPALRTVVLRC